MHNYGGGPSRTDVEYRGYPYTSPHVFDVPTVPSEDGRRPNTPRRPAPQSYRGYPYVHKTEVDIPTISAEEAAKWNMLPRRPAPGYKSVKSVVEEPGTSGSSAETSQEINELKVDTDSDRIERVYIDLPEDSGSVVTDRRRPEDGQSAAQRTQGTQEALSPKLDPDENPVVYIDLPENSGSDVADRRPVENDQTFVQDTIFYDPFKDRRIVSPGSVSSGSSSDSPIRSPLYIRPNPPTSLDVGSFDRVTPSTSAIPPSMSKQTDVYEQFNLPTQYSREDFPEPPPVYTEFDVTPPSLGTPGTTQSDPSVTTPNGDQLAQEAQAEPPRTQVVLPYDPTGVNILCHSCGTMSRCSPVWEIGLITHIAACVVLSFALLPLLFVVYCTNYFKQKSYHCQNCNKLVAYEIPASCQGLVYVKQQ